MPEIAAELGEAVEEAVVDALEHAEEEAQEEAQDAAQDVRLSSLENRQGALEARIAELDSRIAGHDHPHEHPEATVPAELADLAAAVREVTEELEAAIEPEESATAGEVEAQEEVATDVEEEGHEPDVAPRIGHALFRRFGHRG